MSKYNWKGNGTPDGCDNHCIPHPCGPCITGHSSERQMYEAHIKVLVKAFETISNASGTQGYQMRNIADDALKAHKKFIA